MVNMVNVGAGSNGAAGCLTRNFKTPFYTFTMFTIYTYILYVYDDREVRGVNVG
jgi:hypothetical protein